MEGKLLYDQNIGKSIIRSYDSGENFKLSSNYSKYNFNKFEKSF